MTKQLRIIFAGTPAFGLPALKALAESEHELIAVYTQPDRPAGRGRHLQASEIKQWAQSNGYPVYQPLNFKEPMAVEELAALKPDLMVVIAYGLILPVSVLSLPTYGCINVHASLLPKWRGASPIQQALLAGDKETGLTIMQMEAGLDTGPMLNKVRCPIEARETSGSLHDKLAAMAPAPLLDTLEQIAAGSLKAEIQDQDKASYAAKISKENALIQWTKPAVALDREIRAYYPWPIAYTYAGAEVIRIHKASFLDNKASGQAGEILQLHRQGITVQTGEGALRLEQIQFPGGKVLSVADWFNANQNRLKVGQILG